MSPHSCMGNCTTFLSLRQVPFLKFLLFLLCCLLPSFSIKSSFITNTSIPLVLLCSAIRSPLSYLSQSVGGPRLPQSIVMYVMTGLIVLVTSSLQPFESFLSFLISLFLCDDQTAAAHSSQPCANPCCYCFPHHVPTNVEEWHSGVCASPLIIPKSISSFMVSMVIPPILHASHGPFLLFPIFIV